MLQFLLLNMDSNVFCQISMLPSPMLWFLKQMTGLTYQEKHNHVGTYTNIPSFYCQLNIFTHSKFSFWLVCWMNFSHKTFNVFQGLWMVCMSSRWKTNLYLFIFIYYHDSAFLVLQIWFIIQYALWCKHDCLLSNL